MESLDIPFDLSIALRLVNQKKQEFNLWFEPAVEPGEIYQSLNYRKQFLQNMVLLTPEAKSYKMLKAFSFPAKLIKVDKDGNPCQAFFIEKNDLLYSFETINLQGPGFYMLVNHDFCDLFGLVLNDSKVFLMHEPADDLVAQPLEAPLECEKSSAEIVDAVLSQQNGIGLRSLIPYAYVWYHDLLFIVDQMYYPNLMEPGQSIEAVLQASAVLKERGLNPVLRKAAYPAKYYSLERLKITADDTWYGMENRGRYERYNLWPRCNISVLAAAKRN